MLCASRRLVTATPRLVRNASTGSKDHYKVVVVGAGSGGLSVANQIYHRFKAAGTSLNKDDIAILDAAPDHYYQPGWTLVGAGLKPKTDFRRPLQSLIPSHLTLIPENVATFTPSSNSVTTSTGRSVNYDTLVVAAGLQINWDNIQGLSKALADPTSGVSSIYAYETCDKVWDDIEGLRSGNAVFTQPAGVIKCAGAPQKIMWMAWDRFQKTGRSDNINVSFYTGMPTPQMGPMKFIKDSPIADSVGWVAVDQGTLQHTNPEYKNIFAIGDCSSLPTSKTAAAITAQAPVLTENLFSFVNTGEVSAKARYDGYTSCPLLTAYGELMLAEFTYGGVPKETFGQFVDQAKSRRFFYHLKKDLFPAAYWNYMLKGKWFGSKGLIRPKY
ncbi:hypothetical protein H1R20_g15193, partial [Candolleomyces eurysporus]